MGALTKKERDGLDDVFLSIHSNHNKYKKLKEISSLIMSRDNHFSMRNLLKQAKYGLKESKISQLFTLFCKQKKNLSK
ncbi:hypothetical protein KKG72_12425 [bacterium]|nr:hypothetical protein [bacterium]MBU1994980.1 hypothetical protein [bacterium]